MSGKRSTNMQPSDTANHLRTNSPTSSYAGNKEFNQWWEHWMSKVSNSRLNAKSALPKSALDEATYRSELDQTMRQKDAA